MKIDFIKKAGICIVALLIVAFILNFSPGYKRDKYKNITNLVLNDENVTELLRCKIYIDDNKEIYLSEEDIKQFFDDKIYYDETYKTIITTSNTKVASLELNSKKMRANDAYIDILGKAFEIDGIKYIPISELNLVYNIYINYIEETDVVVIDDLSTGMITATVSEASIMKYKPRALSKDIGEVKEGEPVSCFYTTSKGWRLIRTSNGILGYVKANILDNEKIIRQDLNDSVDTKEISIKLSNGATSTINNNGTEIKVKIKKFFNIGTEGSLSTETNAVEENSEYQIWATLSSANFEKQVKNVIKDYKTRTALIDDILSFISNYDIQGVNIEFNTEDSESYTRFLTELAPRLREVGISTNVVLNKKMKDTNYIGIVDYIIREKE